jgi:hypothetical protein
MTPRPSPEQLHELLYFDADGELCWRERPPPTPKQWNTQYANKLAGCLAPDGYRVIRLNGRGWLAHHVTWAMIHGEWPAPGVTIDHKNRDRSDNAGNLDDAGNIHNLRAATYAENNWNRPAYRNNKSGFKGVSFDPGTGKWRAIIRANKVVYRLGRFDTPEEAAAVYNEAARRLHGEFACIVEPEMRRAA